ncbi:polynucleotide kinase-phosphatase [Specibacter cremeus]|uniref:polynucleotide kinase-phosphatase n=1 Tax=Specibacter cremeus TaxID=1629051 RepID=UPI000F76CAEE|nr:polynucleotide kinase-phosphatase [Specibacter cremeus]
MILGIPELSLVVLVGATGAGKSTFAREHFGPFEVISSDHCRGLVSDDENSQDATRAAFEVLNFIAGKRLAAGKLTVVDATNVQRHARQELVELARAHDVLPVAIVLDLPESVSLARDRGRADRSLGAAVVHRQKDQLRRSLRGLAREGFRAVHVLRTEEEVRGVRIERQRLLTDARHEHGPLDVIGDVHGCLGELAALLAKLGYVVGTDDDGRPVDASHPEGRRAVFLGDLVDRGPDSPGVLRLAMGMTANGHAYAVPGNHEHRLVRALDGKKPNLDHGLAETLEQLGREPAEFRRAVRGWCYGLVSHLVFDDGRLVVAHAGLKEDYHGRSSGRVRSFALYGDTTGEIDEDGLPVRYPWAQEYRGAAMVLYGHTPVAEARWLNNTMCLDTGAAFGGSLTALRYPERELVSVPAERVWSEPIRPLGGAARPEDELRLDDVVGRRVVDSPLHGRVSVREENAAGALEVMSRFALAPKWLGYLPPTMAPVGTSPLDGFLEHPAEAFGAYAAAGVGHVICEEKHMGSRAVVLLCRDASVARRRFNASGGETGVVYTRTGRAFFDSPLTESLLGRMRSAVAAAGLWDELGTDWILLDGEMLPWSLKTGDLLRDTYASTGAAARGALSAAAAGLAQASGRGLDVAALQSRVASRSSNADAFTAAYRNYVWPTDGLDGVQFAPFQVLATEGASWYTSSHAWHLDVADRLVAADPATFRTTARLVVDPSSPESVASGIDWWLDLTGAGGEGMVVKPLENHVVLQPGSGRAGPVQPGVKVRGREYLRIIYGPDYTEPDNLRRLKERSLNHKRSLALREHALGLESLDRLVAGEPLWRVHEAVFGVLALESEPVDPRL